MDFNQNQNGRTINILVAMTDQKDQQLIAQCIQANRPKSKLIYCSTADELLPCLNTTEIEYYNFPHLLLLDLDIAPRSTFWPLLQEIRISYRLLCVVIFSSKQSRKSIKQAYDLGAHAFIHKADDQAIWREQVDTLANYWLRVVCLPKNPVSNK